MPDPLPPFARRGWTYAAAWIPILTIFVTAFLAGGSPLGLAVRNAVANLLPGALLGLAVLQVPRHLPWRGDRRGRAFALLGFLLLVFLGLSCLGWLALFRLDAWVFGIRWKFEAALRVMPWRALNDCLIFCALAAVAYARQAAAESRELVARAARAEMLRARAELETLRSQLNPHFILNTFHALIGLVRRDPAVAQTALERLGDLLRYGLRVQRENLDLVPLGDEWAFVETYLELERLRLAERLRVGFTAAEGTLEVLVPSFSLQTLVENSVRHTIAPRVGGGRLDIAVRREGDRLSIRVEDEGDGPVGSPPGLPNGGQGVGLRLLRERLQALYGGEAALAVEVHERGGQALLEVPVRRAGDEEP